MPQPTVTFVLPDGSTVVAHPGAIVGRLPTAQVRLADPRVSEAHALVSLRDSAMWLLALRGGLRVDGRPAREVRLGAPLRIGLASGLDLTVAEVVVPDVVDVLELAGTAWDLVGTVAAVLTGPPRVVPRHASEARVHLVHAGSAWMVSEPDATPLPYETPFDLAGLPARLRTRSLDGIENRTALEPGVTPKAWRARFDRLTCDGAQVAVGKAAQVVWELDALGGRDERVAWRVIAGEVWRRELDAEGLDDGTLNRRWDAAVKRLRAGCRALGLRETLLFRSADGFASIELGFDTLTSVGL